MPSVNENTGRIDSAHRQMGAVIAKAMESMEGMEPLHQLHPIDFHELRKLVIRGFWECYNIGLWLGQEAKNDLQRPEHRAEHS